MADEKDKDVKKKLMQELEEVIKKRKEKKNGIASKIICPKKLSHEERKKKIANEEKVRNRRDESINNVLISDVPQSLKDEHADYIIASHKTSKAGETFERLEKERRIRVVGRINWGEDPIDDRETYFNDWWKTDALIKNSIEMTKYDARCRRRQKIKDFFYTVSGLKLIKSLNKKKQEKKYNNKIAQEFLNNIALQEFRENKEKLLSENLADFIRFILKRKGWRGIMPREGFTAISVKFMKKESLKEDDTISKKMLLSFYRYFRERG